MVVKLYTDRDSKDFSMEENFLAHIEIVHRVKLIVIGSRERNTMASN